MCPGFWGTPGRQGAHTTDHEAPNPGDLGKRQCTRAIKRRSDYCTVVLETLRDEGHLEELLD